MSHAPSGSGCVRWSVMSPSVRAGQSLPPRKVTVKMASAWPSPERWTITPALSGTSEAMAVSASASEASQGRCAVASLVRVGVGVGVGVGVRVRVRVTVRAGVRAGVGVKGRG